MQYECDNAFPNLKCDPEPFLLENKHWTRPPQITPLAQNNYHQPAITHNTPSQNISANF